MKNKLRIMALLLTMVMMISLVGCGGDKEPTETTTQPTETTKGNESATTETPTTHPSETESNENLAVHENTFFTVKYKEEDGWTITEDDFYMTESGGNADLQILNAEGYAEILVDISAYEEDHESFRETMHNYGIDEKAYVAGSLETVTVGGQPMLYVDKDNGERYFFGRNEAAGVTYNIGAENWEDPRVPALIENITCTASGTDNVDPPWYWEGEPFSGSTVSQTVGTYTLTSRFLPMDEPLITYETFNHDIAVVGDKVYLLSDYALYQYAYDGASLTFVKEIPLDTEYEVLEKGADGNIILSSFMEPVIGHDGDAIQFSYEGPEKFAVAPGATWGISWFYSGEDCQLYSFHDGALTGSPFPFPEVDSISSVTIDNNYILVSGSSVEDNEQYIFAYDYAGELMLQLGGEPDGFGLGSITYAISTDNGFLALDGNMRELVLWTTDGTWVGAVDDGDLFGTGYPWIAAADIADDGSILVVMSDTRADESADEVVVFKLSGF